MQPDVRRPGLAVGLLAFGLVVGPARSVGAAAQATTLAALDAGGHPLTTAVTGERWTVAGTVTPYVPGDVARVTVTRAGVTTTTAVPVRPVPGTSTDGFRLPMRIIQPGALSIRAVLAHANGAVEPAGGPLAVTVRDEGRRRPGCGGPAEVVTATHRRPPRLGSGVPAGRGMLLEPGARVAVPRGGRLVLESARARYSIGRARVVVDCRDLRLVRGNLRLSAPAGHRSLARLVVARADVLDVRPGTRLTAREAATARLVLKSGGARVQSMRFPSSALAAQPGDVVLVAHRGLPRLSTWPFARAPADRPARARDHLPAFWADGLPCSIGCRPPGAETGWPLRPFHAQHALRAGLNEIRPANFHIGIDIQALDGTPVYAVQSGFASIAGQGTVDERVQVGDYLYWHVIPRVQAGEFVRAFHTVVGVILHGARHLHFSEVRGGVFLNPLRPGGRVLAPWRDTDRPVIGPARDDGDSALVDVFDPQSFRVTLRYRTPVLAPSAVAWRASDRHGRRLGPLVFAYRGSQHLPDSLRSVIYGPGTHRPEFHGHGPAGWSCFDRHVVCVPRWDYRLRGVPPNAASITVYAWDWAGNVSVRTSRLR